MRDFSALNTWAIDALHEFGFHKVLKTISIEVVVNKPLLTQELGQKLSWGGFYHIFEQNGSICLYMFNQVENKAQVLMIDSDLSLADLILTKEAKSADEILKESMQKALTDPKLETEKKRIEAFLSKSKTKKDVQMSAVNSIESNITEKVSGSEKESLFNLICINSLHDLSALKYIEEVLFNEHIFAKYYSLKDIGQLFEVKRDMDVKFFDQEYSLKKGEIIFPLKNKAYELFAILELDEGGQITAKTIISPRPSLVNCYTLGDLQLEQSKWVFIVSDFLSGLMIRAETGVNVIVCESEEGIGLLVNDLRGRHKELKIGCFLNGRLSTNQLINIYKNDLIGVYYFNIAPDFTGSLNWNSFILEKKQDANFSLQGTIKEIVGSQMERVNKLQAVV